MIKKIAQKIGDREAAIGIADPFLMAIVIAIATAISIFDLDRDRDRDFHCGDRAHALLFVKLYFLPQSNRGLKNCLAVFV